MRERDAVGVVADQVGTPDLGPRSGARRSGRPRTRRGSTGMHHWTDAGVASWYDFAVAIQEEALALGLLPARGPDPAAPDRGVSRPPRAGRPTACSTSSAALAGARRSRLATGGSNLRHDAAGAAPVRSLLVTGGAGFIGANFVHYWLDAHPERPGRGARRADLRRQSRQPRAGARTSRASSSSTATSATPGLAEELLRDARGRRRSCTSPRNRTWTARFTGPTPSSRTNVAGHARAAQGGAQGLAGRGQGRSASLPPRLDRRGLRLARARRSAVHARRTPYAPNSPYAASKAASDHLVRAYHHTYGLPVTTSNCSNNYGPLPVSREADPADAGQRAGGQAAAGLRRRPQRARLAVRGRPLPGGRARAGAGEGRRDLQRRRPERVDEHRPRAAPLPRWSTRPSRPTPGWPRASPAAPPPGGKTPGHCSPS